MASPPPPWRQPLPWRASSAPDKRRREHDDQRDADVNVKQKLIHRITAKLPVDWHPHYDDRITLLETCEPPHLGFLNENIKKDTPISICTFGIENFERLGRGEMIVWPDIQCRFKGKSKKYDVLKSHTDTIRTADNAGRVICSLERNHPEICSGRYIVLVDCRCYHDPDFGKDSFHLGWKDETVAGLVNNEEATSAIIDQVIEGIKDAGVKLTNGLVIALMCKSGFHRSLVAAKCVHYVLEPVHDDVKAFHLSQREWATRGCQRHTNGRCPLCQYRSKTKLRQLALALYQQKFDERLAAEAAGHNGGGAAAIRTLPDATRRAASAHVYSTSAVSSKVPASKAMPKIVRPRGSVIIAKSSRKIHEPDRSRSPLRAGSTPHRRVATFGSRVNVGNLHTSSACGTPDSAWLDLVRTPQGKVLYLITRSRMGKTTWCEYTLSELCRRAVEKANVTFDAPEDNVLTELYRRVTMIQTDNESRMRTKEEIDALFSFWWKLGSYRAEYFKRNGRVESTEEALSTTAMNKVKKIWKDDEMYWDLTDNQRKAGHLPSLYNAALNNKGGWSSAANASIKFQLPQLPHMGTSGDVTQVPPYLFQRWCCDMLEWLKKFTSWEICRKAVSVRPPLP